MSHTSSQTDSNKDSVNQPGCRVAVVEWSAEDGIAAAVGHELARLGYQTAAFPAHAAIPKNQDVVFSFGPLGKLLRLVRQLEALPADARPLLVHWNTEGLPDIRLPWVLMRSIGVARSWVGRSRDNLDGRVAQGTLADRLISLADARMHRFRWLGDYYYAYGHGVLALLFDSSTLYSQLRSRHDLPTQYAPWGASPTWYADLQLERDIDVLWMGDRRDKRRRVLIDQIRRELQRHGVDIYIADNEENPFIFREERTRMLNRAKITLNITRTWYDDNFSRFSMAAPNRSLVVSEPMLPHCPAYQAGVHYVSASHDELARTILYYLRNAEERARIVDNAYRLSTTELTFFNSVRAIMREVERARRQRARALGQQVRSVRDQHAR